MTFAQTVVLGALAGFTIYIGLPVARLKQRTAELQCLLTALALGVLLFLIWDILSKALEPVVDAMKTGAKTGHWGMFAVLGSMFVLGMVVGLVGLVIYDARTTRGLAADGRMPGQMALMIATGLGFHNFSEGLAIGQAAATNAIGFATILVIGFALHNITEGFAVAAPLSVSADRPSWRRLGLLGLVGGGPTFAGTLVGYQVTILPAFVLFLGLAAGALIYVIGEMFAASRRMSAPVWAASGLVTGFFIALGTDLILTLGGA